MTPRLLLALVCPVLLLAICGHATAATQIEAGDRLKVVVLGVEELTGEAMVGTDGTISIPIVGSCNVAGKTTDEAALLLKTILRKYIKSPEVHVEIAQKAATMAVLSGRVKKPSAYAIGQHTTIVELIGLAGGVDTNADLSAVSVVHSGGSIPVTYNVQDFIDGKSQTSNPVVKNGDLVTVPERISTVGTVFVLGEVKRIGNLDLRQGMRIHDAIGEAGGITDMADPQLATLKSKDGEPVKFDLVKALAQDPVEDKPLKSGDTIYIQTLEGTINIYGAVNKPGSYPLKKSVPLTDALAMAGGYAANAHIQDVQILRASQQKAIKVNLADVQKMKADNVAIVPGDTIVMGQRGEKTSLWQVISAVGTLGWLVW